jgi:hypothetical protein
MATLLALLGLGVWVGRNRRADLWPVLGVVAIVSRLASYHGVYDDSLVLIALIELFRLANQAGASSRRKAWSRSLFVLAWVPLLLPATMATLGLPWSIVHHGIAPLVWLAAAACLARNTGDRLGDGRKDILVEHAASRSLQPSR